MFSFIHFVFLSICLPIALSVLYSVKPTKKNTNYYQITKGVLYLFNAGAVIYSFFPGKYDTAVACLTVSIAIFEGLPLILLPLFNAGKREKQQDK